MSSTTGSAPSEDLKYKLSNCNLQIEVVQLPESVNQKLNSQLMSGEKISTPMVVTALTNRISLLLLKLLISLYLNRLTILKV
jgi:hypothetical protein